MKPHEETWGERDVIVVIYDDKKADRERLARAAPKMARALLDLGCVRLVGTPQEKWHTDYCWDRQECGRYECLPTCSAARAVFAEAGVLP